MIKQLGSHLVFAILLSGPVMAGEPSRHLGPHTHGLGTLNIAIEGGVMEMEFEAPGADIIGFEHYARTEQDKARLAAAKKKLAMPLQLFSPTDDAQCKTRSSDVHFTNERHEHHEEHHGHDEHHEEHHGHDAAQLDGETHGDAIHGEFHASYKLHCKNVAALSGMTFDYFKSFPNSRALVVNFISAKAQKQFKVTRDQPALGLAGMM